VFSMDDDAAAATPPRPRATARPLPLRRARRRRGGGGRCKVERAEQRRRVQPAARESRRRRGRGIIAAALPHPRLPRAAQCAGENDARLCLLFILRHAHLGGPQANQLQGKGVESVSHYSHARLSYADIGNIHTMRESVVALGEVRARSPRAVCFCCC